MKSPISTKTWTSILLATIAVGSFTLPTAWAAPVQQAYVKASNTGAGDLFGHSVALSGDTMVVGSFEEDSAASGVNGNQSDNHATNSGAAYVFVRRGTNWSQQAYLKASNTGADNSFGWGGSFGWSVAVSGDTVVVGARGEDSKATGVNGNQKDNTATNSGAAYVFVRNGTKWTQQAYLKASNPVARDDFGFSVAISGDTVVVGALWADRRTGAAYVFVRDKTNWTQQAHLKASSPGDMDQFGWSVGVSGDTVVVGAVGESSNTTGVNGNPRYDGAAYSSGATYVFVRIGTNWTQQAYLKASNTGRNDAFGQSVGVSGDTVVVGAAGEKSAAAGVNANQDDNSATNAGAAYVFVRRGTNWSQQAYLKASNTEVTDRFGDIFGISAAVSSNLVVVGASGEDSAATVVNGNQSDNNASRSGAAYVFVRSGTNSSQRAYLKASNAESEDQFGRSVVVSGDTIVVGAAGVSFGGEDSSATGVNGNQSDNSAKESGAAYVFTGFGLAQKPDPPIGR